MYCCRFLLHLLLGGVCGPLIGYQLTPIAIESEASDSAKIEFESQVQKGFQRITDEVDEPENAKEIQPGHDEVDESIKRQSTRIIGDGWINEEKLPKAWQPLKDRIAEDFDPIIVRLLGDVINRDYRVKRGAAKGPGGGGSTGKGVKDTNSKGGSDIGVINDLQSQIQSQVQTSASNPTSTSPTDNYNKEEIKEDSYVKSETDQQNNADLLISTTIRPTAKTAKLDKKSKKTDSVETSFRPTTKIDSKYKRQTNSSSITPFDQTSPLSQEGRTTESIESSGLGHTTVGYKSAHDIMAVTTASSNSNSRAAGSGPSLTGSGVNSTGSGASSTGLGVSSTGSGVSSTGSGVSSTGSGVSSTGSIASSVGSGNSGGGGNGAGNKDINSEGGGDIGVTLDKKSQSMAQAQTSTSKLPSTNTKDNYDKGEKKKDSHIKSETDQHNIADISTTIRPTAKTTKQHRESKKTNSVETSIRPTTKIDSKQERQTSSSSMAPFDQTSPLFQHGSTIDAFAGTTESIKSSNQAPTTVDHKSANYIMAVTTARPNSNSIADGSGASSTGSGASSAGSDASTAGSNLNSSSSSSSNLSSSSHLNSSLSSSLSSIANSHHADLSNNFGDVKNRTNCQNVYSSSTAQQLVKVVNTTTCTSVTEKDVPDSNQTDISSASDEPENDNYLVTHFFNIGDDGTTSNTTCIKTISHRTELRGKRIKETKVEINTCKTIIVFNQTENVYSNDSAGLERTLGLEEALSELHHPEKWILSDLLNIIDSANISMPSITTQVRFLVFSVHCYKDFFYKCLKRAF